MYFWQVLRCWCFLCGGPPSENCCHGHLWETLGTTWLHNGLCFYVAGSRCHLGTTVFPFQGITCFLFSVFDPDSLLSPQLWSSYRISTARAPGQTTEQPWGLSHPLLKASSYKLNACKGSTRTQAESTRALGVRGWEVGVLLMDRHGGQPESESTLLNMKVLDTWLQNTLVRRV